MMNEAQELKRVRLSVERVDEPYMDVRVVGEDTLLRLDITVSHHTMRAAQLLQVGMQLNALSSTLEGDVLRPQLIVVEPDFLLDTTSVTSCIKGWGESAFNHFLAKFKPMESTVYTLLGDFANQFLDDNLNLPDADYLSSMHKMFADRAIDICACKEINASFFEETKKQFANIQQVVKELSQQPYMHQGKVNIHNSAYGAKQNYIPFKLNSANVMPVIFASVIFTIPQFISGLMNTENGFTTFVTKYVSYTTPVGFAVYMVLIFAFSFFYTFIQVNPSELAKNLSRQGGYIPGIRPGKETVSYIKTVLGRITLIGALFIALIAGLPIIFSSFVKTNLPSSVSMGGTSILIIVGVALETCRQLESSLVNRNYRGVR